MGLGGLSSPVDRSLPGGVGPRDPRRATISPSQAERSSVSLRWHTVCRFHSPSGGSRALQLSQSAEEIADEKPVDDFSSFFSIKEINAKGFKKLTVQPESSQNSKGKGGWKKGKWQVMITRPLETDDKKIDIQFEKGKLIPYALAVWDGSNKEIKGQKSITSWYYLTLEMTTPSTVYIYAIVAIIMAVCIQFWVIARIRRFPPEIPAE